MSPNAHRPPGARAGLALLLAAVVAGCGGEPPADDGAYDNVMSFDTTSVQLIRQRDTLSLTVQLAVTPAQRSMGLMERQRLADNAGMLFVYDSTQPPDAGFWMYRTRIPLDIAFIDSTGVIRAIRSMTPCPTTIAEGCPTYAGDVPYRHALEVNAGFFAQHRLGVGDSVLIPDLATAGGGSAGQPRPR